MQLTWIKCQGEAWCKLSTVNLEHPHFDNMKGVYIIWHGGAHPATVYVGQGTIRDRLQYHRKNPQIQLYDNLGLYATWASVPETSLDGVEKYLGDRLKPIVTEKLPDAVPISVNLPW